MRTDELVAALAADAAPVDSARAERRFRDRLLIGPAIALLLMLVTLGPRPDLAEAMRLPLFWVKAGVPAFIAVAGWALLYRLAQKYPGLPEPVGVEAMGSYLRGLPHAENSGDVYAILHH